MADPKGPEGDKAKPAHSARPRAQTLDLSATDVTGKPETEKQPGEQAGDKIVAGEKAAAAEAAAKAAATSSDAKADAKSEAKSDAKPDPKPAPRPEPEPKPAARPDLASAQPRPDAARSRPAAAPVQPPAPERRGWGALGFTLATLLGAALAILVVSLFGDRLIQVPGPDMSRVVAAETKAAAADGRATSLARELEALRAQVAKLGDSSAIEARLGQIGKTVEGTTGRVGTVETDLKALAKKVGEPAARDPDVPLLVGRVAGIELRLEDLPTAENYATLDGRIAGVESRIGDIPSNAALAALSARVDALGETVPQRIGQATSPINTKVDALADALRKRPPGDPVARLVVALGALGQALDAGRPFDTELKSVKAAGGAAAEFGALDAVAAKGLPTRPDLGATAASVIAKLDPVKGSPRGSLIERFVASAGGVVKITPLEGEGSDPAAKRARFAELASAGDLEGALAARGALDEEARAATEEWARLASARVAAEQAVQSARTAALARLSSND